MVIVRRKFYVCVIVSENSKILLMINVQFVSKELLIVENGIDAMNNALLLVLTLQNQIEMLLDQYVTYPYQKKSV